MKDQTGLKYLDPEFYKAYQSCKRLVWFGWHLTDGVLLDPWQDDSLINLAKGLFPHHLDAGKESSCLEETVEISKKCVRSNKTVFNACFTSSIGVAVADIITPLGEDSKELIFVCPTKGIHPLFIEKIAFTTAVLIKNGIELKKISLLRINPEFKKESEFNPRNYFIKQIITGRVALRVNNVEDNVSEIFRIIKSEEPPAHVYDKRCLSPFVCPFFENCWQMPPEQNILSLYRGSKKIKKLIETGICDLTQISDEIELTERQKIQVTSAKTGEPFVNKPAIKKFLRKLVYPLHFIDFETVSSPLPLFKGTRPFELIPYEFSLNIQEHPGGDVQTTNYIARGDDDPRREIMKILNEKIQSYGSVIAYNAQFEKHCLQSCARALHDYSAWVDDVSKRMVDLLEPFKALHYYHPAQRGSASLKSVLPCLTGKGYTHFAIRNGEEASKQFIKLFRDEVLDEKKEMILHELETYCYTDSIGMLWIIEALKKLVE
ncbi:MAG: DUF2779 domain-containing protein [Verrucomicrobiae bacterium]|nr:DUF2779 domain-containing protein [Verrucomicrobiae bacterium]